VAIHLLTICPLKALSASSLGPFDEIKVKQRYDRPSFTPNICQQPSEHPGLTVSPPWAMHEPLGRLIQYYSSHGVADIQYCSTTGTIGQRLFLAVVLVTKENIICRFLCVAQIEVLGCVTSCDCCASGIGTASGSDCDRKYSQPSNLLSFVCTQANTNLR
jgi:hypothetical protein